MKLQSLHSLESGVKIQFTTVFSWSSHESDLVLIHDAARPFISPLIVERVVQAAALHGAAACGMPLKFTVKETHDRQFCRAHP